MIDLRQILRQHFESLHSSTWGDSFMLDGKDQTEAAIDYLLREWESVNNAIRKHLGADGDDELSIGRDGKVRLRKRTRVVVR